MNRKQKKTFLKFLRYVPRPEPLEARNLLAVLVDSPFQNPLDANDLNCDGTESPADALIAINALNAGMSGQLTGRFAPPSLNGHVMGAISDFMDADGDGNLSPGDALHIINAINTGHHGGPPSDLPATDQQPNAPGPDAQLLDLTHGFAKVRAAINTDGDVDVFQVAPTKTELNVALFSAGNGAMSVTVVDTDGNTLGTAATQTGDHRPAKANVDVQSGKTYYLVVKADPGVTGQYGLGVLNFDEQEFPPTTDSPLGTDIHGDTTATASALTLNHGHARVASNIDAAGDIDMFQLTAVDGKLVVEADAEFPLSVTVSDSTGKILGTLTTSDRHLEINSVTAGTYFVSVAAANGTDTGAYHLNVVNIALPTDGDSDGDHHGLPTPQRFFERLDSDHDGAVSLAEFKAGVPLGRTMLAANVFANWDTDHSGNLSLDEFVAGLKTLPPLIHHHVDAALSALLTSND
jgi:hypothetical protein